MRLGDVFRVLVFSSALAMLMGTAAAAQEDSSSKDPEVAALKEELAIAREQLAAESERSRDLLHRIACTEELLQDYHACQFSHEAESPAYWDCVRNTLDSGSDCGEKQ